MSFLLHPLFLEDSDDVPDQVVRHGHSEVSLIKIVKTFPLTPLLAWLQPLVLS